MTPTRRPGLALVVAGTLAVAVAYASAFSGEPRLVWRTK